MEKSVPESLKQTTKKCPHSFACLAQDSEPPCTAHYINGENVIFIDQKPLECPYCMEIGSSCVCLCPIHYYLKTNPQNKTIL